MTRLGERLRHGADRFTPPLTDLEDIEARAGRRLRARRASAALVAAVVGVAGVGIAIGALQQGRRDGEPGRPAACATAPSGSDASGWWTGDGSGESLVGGPDAEVAGDGRFAPGLVGQAFAFDGDGDFAFVPDDPALDVGRADFTIDLWVRFESTDGEQVLVEKYVETLDPEVDTSIGWTFSKLSTGALIFAFGGGAGGIETAPIDLPSRTWIHLAASRQGETVSVFVDGREVGSGPLRMPRLSFSSDVSLKIGHRGSPDDTPGSHDDRGFFLHGRVDEVRLTIGRALSNREIERIVEARGARDC